MTGVTLTALPDRERLELLVLQPTAFCNLDCRYCYVPDRANARRMTEGTLRKVCSALARSKLLRAGQPVEVLWHAGEPLAAGLDFYRNAARLFREVLGPRLPIQQTFQTNATLVSASWCDYFLETGARIGISLDGPREIHDRQRPYRRGRGSFDQVMRGVGLLRDRGLPIHALCVLTPLSLAQPRRMFEFFTSERILDVAFNIEETEGEHRASALTTEVPGGELQERYSTFMRYFLEENLRTRSKLTVRELSIQSRRLLGRSRDRTLCADEAENHIGRVITVSRSGEVSSWSPELASGAGGDSARFSLGNIQSVDSIDELLTNQKARGIQAEIDEGIERCRRTCSYFGVCGGGLPSNKFYENGAFASTETLRCRLHVQALTELLMDHARRPETRV